LLGSALREARDPRAAEVVSRQAQRLHPADVWLNYNLTQCLEKLARRQEAIRFYMAARSIRPEVAHGLAHALDSGGEPGEAIATFRELTRLRPAHGRHSRCLGQILRTRGRHPEADAAMDAAITLLREETRQRPDDVHTIANLGRALSDRGNHEEALAHTLRDQAKFADALAEYPEALRLVPDDARALYEFDKLLTELGKVEELIAEYREMIRLRPESDAVLNNLAWKIVLFRDRPAREFDEALAHARKCVELTPKDANHVNTLALAEYRVRHWDETIAAAKASLALRNDGNASDWFFLAMAHAQKGEKEEARKWFDKAVAWTKEKDPKAAELRQFWTEAALLLGQPAPGAPGQRSTTAPAVQKPH
jgi:tetratricopeptide (TPR) repeat protein